MNSLVFVTVISLLLLFFSFLLIYAKFETKTWNRFLSLMVIFFCMAFPVIYAVYGEIKHPSYSASMGLGVSFLFTWVLTAIIFIFSIVFRYKSQNEDEFSLM